MCERFSSSVVVAMYVDNSVGTQLMCVSVCVFVKLYMTAPYGPVILAILQNATCIGPPKGLSMIPRVCVHIH